MPNISAGHGWFYKELPKFSREMVGRNAAGAKISDFAVRRQKMLTKMPN